MDVIGAPKSAPRAFFLAGKKKFFFSLNITFILQPNESAWSKTPKNTITCVTDLWIWYKIASDYVHALFILVLRAFYFSLTRFLFCLNAIIFWLHCAFCCNFLFGFMTLISL